MVVVRLSVGFMIAMLIPFALRAEKASYLLKGRTFALTQVNGASVLDHKEVEDFDLYRLRIGRGPGTLMIYEGFAPHFNAEKRPVTTTVVNKMPSTQCLWTTERGWNREVLVTLPRSADDTSHIRDVVHFTYLSLNRAEKGIADSVIATIELVPRHSGFDRLPEAR
jgi:hypothetical protein